MLFAEVLQYGKTEYELPEKAGLSVTFDEEHEAAAGGFRRLAVSVTNGSESPFKGIVRIGVTAAGNSCGTEPLAAAESGTERTEESLSKPGSGEEPFFLLPGFMVGTNRGDAPLTVESKWPRLRKSPAEFPASPWWLVRADRLSHPVAMLYETGEITGISGAVTFTHHGKEQYAGFGCDIEKHAVYYTIGWENAPWFFVQSHLYFPREVQEAQCIALAPGESLTATIYTFDERAGDVRSVNGIIRRTYEIFHEPPREGASLSEAVRLLAGAVDRDAWMPGHRAYAGFVFDRGDHMDYRPLPSTAWTNGLSVAFPELLSSYRLKDETMREHALTLIQDIVDQSLNPVSGLPWTVADRGQEDFSGPAESGNGRENIWSNRGWWYDRLPAPGHTGYLVGQTLYYILRAYETEQKYAGVSHDDWLDFVGKIVAKLGITVNSDGEYPYVLSEESGAGLVYDSMSGAWCLAASAYYEKISGGSRNGKAVSAEADGTQDRNAETIHAEADGTQDRNAETAPAEAGGTPPRIENLLKSEVHYYRHYVARVSCYGGPLDIDKGIDSEGVLAYIRAVRRLHEMTQQEELLNHMKDALEYEFTFKFCYCSPVSVPPLNRGWSSTGGSITSVTNPHIHPMSSSIVDEMLYYLQFRDDGYIRSRLNDTVGWGLQTFARTDREYDFGRAGWMSERFCYSQGLLTERYPDGSPASTWFALMPWASGSILEGLAGNLWDISEGRGR